MLLILATMLQPVAIDMDLPVFPESPAGQAMIAERAREICGSQFPAFGRYRFQAKQTVPNGESPSIYRFHQELECRDEPPPPPVGPRLPDGWQASATDQRAAEAATRAYFTAVDAGEVGHLEAMMSPAHRADQTTAARTEQLAAFRRQAGRPGMHRIIRVTWYVNPPGVAPGAYAAVDFDRSYAGLAVSCGYVAWYRQPDGRLLLVREETGSAPRSPGLTPQQIAQARIQLQCRD